jgi:hypothetical protein
MGRIGLLAYMYIFFYMILIKIQLHSYMLDIIMLLVTETWKNPMISTTSTVT